MYLVAGALIVLGLTLAARCMVERKAILDMVSEMWRLIGSWLGWRMGNAQGGVNKLEFLESLGSEEASQRSDVWGNLIYNSSTVP